jgi:hypothetical protein
VRGTDKVYNVFKGNIYSDTHRITSGIIEGKTVVEGT